MNRSEPKNLRYSCPSYFIRVPNKEITPMNPVAKLNENTLHITSDIIMAENIKEAGIVGDTLAWQDALYEGPVVADLSLNKLSMVRAEYFSRLGWSDANEIKQRFIERNEKVMLFSHYQEIVLWFEHNLYNQLQLLQIVSWLSEQETGRLLISLISVDKYPGVKMFFGLASLNYDQLRNLYQKKSEMTLAQMSVCQKGWAAFTSSHPEGLLKFFPRDMSSMPFLKNAIARLAQQFPAKSNGLSQIESLILQSLIAHVNDAEEMYHFVQCKEPVPFLNRAMFYGYLQKLSNCKHPLIEREKVELEEVIDAESAAVCERETTQVIRFSLTATARQALHNWVDLIQLNGIDRWVGGVHLRDGNIWRFDKETRELKKTYL